MKTQITKPSALTEYVARCAEIEGLLSELKSRVDDHFGVLPEEVNWGHVGDLERVAHLLRRATGAEE